LIASSQAAPADRSVRELRRLPADGDRAPRPAERVQRLAAELPAPEAFAVIEHLYGVAPLVAALLPAGELSRAVAAGDTMGALGLFTPTPAGGWGGAMLTAEALSEAGCLRLSGSLRLAGSSADGALALARIGPRTEDRTGDPGEAEGARCHLVWIGLADLEGDSEAPFRVVLDRAEVPAGGVSGPLDLSPEGELARRVARYAELWALAAALTAQGGVRSLRRAARLAGFQGHQLVAMPLTEAEIEAECALAAARQRLAESGAATSAESAPTLSWATALAAARALAGTADAARRLWQGFGLEAEDGSSFADPFAETALAAWLGGPTFLEHELGRALLRMEATP
jgi:hypothetical protein